MDVIRDEFVVEAENTLPEVIVSTLFQQPLEQRDGNWTPTISSVLFILGVLLIMQSLWRIWRSGRQTDK